MKILPREEESTTQTYKLAEFRNFLIIDFDSCTYTCSHTLYFVFLWHNLFIANYIFVNLLRYTVSNGSQVLWIWSLGCVPNLLLLSFHLRSLIFFSVFKRNVCGANAHILHVSSTLSHLVALGQQSCAIRHWGFFTKWNFNHGCHKRKQSAQRIISPCILIDGTEWLSMT